VRKWKNRKGVKMNNKEKTKKRLYVPGEPKRMGNPKKGKDRVIATGPGGVKKRLSF
jgi:hypothetical protein